MYKKKQVDKAGTSTTPMDAKDIKFNMKEIMKDIEHLGMYI